MEAQDTTQMSLEEKVDYLITAVTHLLNKKPTSHPLWSPEECDTACELTGTPVPSAHAVPIVADDGNTYTVHPGLMTMMVDNEVDHFPLDWLDSLQTPEYAEYLETPKRKKGRPATKPKKQPHTPVDMTNWTIADVPRMQRKELMQAAKAVGVTQLLIPVGAKFMNEETEWIRSAVTAMMTEADTLPPFTADANKHIEPVRIHKAVQKKPAPSSKPAATATPGKKQVASSPSAPQQTARVITTTKTVLGGKPPLPR